MGDHSHDRRTFLRYSAAASAGFALTGCAPRRFQQSAGGAIVDEPAAPVSLPSPTNRQGQFADVNGARLFYESSGQGEPIILLHGYPLSGALFARNRDALSQRFRFITVDQRGYGKSQAPGIPDSIATYAHDALSLLDQLGVQRAIIGGHSMGGPITFEMYRRAPERFRGMILIDTTNTAASPIEAGLWQGFAKQAQQQGVASLVDPLMKDMLTGQTRVNQPEMVNFLGTVIKQASQDAAVGGAQALAGRPDSTSLLGQIKVPTLVYVGVEDTIYPVKVAQMMSQAIQGSKLVTIPGAAHAAPFEAPDATNRAILDWATQI